MKLKSWEHRKISFGGRITLLKAVLNALPIYHMSFYCLPKKTLSVLTSLHRNFLWGGNESDSKIAWVKWGKICESKERGGLGVRDLECFNLALIGKWLWRYLDDRKALWARVITSLHGRLEVREGGFMSSRGRSGWSGWWKDVVDIGSGNGGKWFRENIDLRVGEGVNTRFWDDLWAGELSLKSRFPRLFYLSRDQESFINSMGFWVGGVWYWNWNWRRGLFDRELHLLSELITLISRYKLLENEEDRWIWKADPKGAYTTKAAYEIIKESRRREPVSRNESYTSKLIWNKIAPLKVQAMVWRLLQDRLPTRSNLHRRNILQQGAQTRCPVCGNEEETANHVFISCPKIASLWLLCYRWLGVIIIQHFSIERHFLIHSGIYRGKNCSKIASCIWEGMMWLIWKARNKLVFEGEELVPEKLLEELKGRTWSWLLARKIIPENSSFETWLIDPLYPLKNS